MIRRLVLVALTATLGSMVAPSHVAADSRIDSAERPTPPRPDLGAFADLDVNVLPDDYLTGQQFAQFGPTTGAELAIVGADKWHAAGVDGTGVRIGVIDFFDVTTYWDESETGPTPIANVTAKCVAHGADCSAEFFDGVDEGGDDHGVAVVEILKDMAPGAQVYIGSAMTPNDYVTLIDWFAANGVTIISRSLGSRYDGPGDGRGAMTDVAAYANAKGILWVNSGGNSGSSQYYRQSVRLGGADGRQVAFGPSGTSTYLKFNGCVALGGVRWITDWDKPAASRTDYDVYLINAPTGSPEQGLQVASSEYDQQSGGPPIEHIVGDYCPKRIDARPASLYLQIIVYASGDNTSNDVIEILDYGSGMSSFTQAEFSASTSIVDSDLPGVVAVGAIDPPTSGNVAFYSSQGPTNDLRIAPDLAAPSGFFSTIFGANFSGTSSAAPVVAGGAALMQDAGLASGPSQLGELLRACAVDRGAPGTDNASGYGELRLPSPLDATPSRFVPIPVPTRVLDTRPETAVGPAQLITRVQAGGTVELPILAQAGVAATGVTAVAVNVTAVAIDRPGFVQVMPTGRACIGRYSNINLEAAGQTRSNMAIVPIGNNGSISLYATGTTDFVVDLLGYYQGTDGPTADGRFVELSVPERLIDTRGTPSLGEAVPRAVPGSSTIDPALIGALVVTVTGTQASSPGWVQVFPADHPEAVSRSSTVNFGPGESVANTAIVPVGPGGLGVTGYFGPGGTGHVVIDLVGYITSTAGSPSSEGRFVPVVPGRAFDSRLSTGPLAAGQVITVDANAAPGVSVPSDASGVVWNFASVDARRPGFGRVWSTAAPQPATSAFNWTRVGEVRAAALITAANQGKVAVVVNDGPIPSGNTTAHVIADVFGYFT